MPNLFRCNGAASREYGMVHVGDIRIPADPYTTTINCSSKLKDYKELTSADFMLDLVSYYTQATVSGREYSSSMRKSYNADTGVLTVTASGAMTGNGYINIKVYACSLIS